MTPRSSRAVRFVRALALLGGGAMSACSSGGPSDGHSSAPTDTIDGGGAIEAAIDAAIDAAPSSNDAPATQSTEAAVEASRDDVASEASAETSSDLPPTGPRCVDDDAEVVPCVKGSVCHVDTTNGALRCDPTAEGLNKPCGDVSCGWLCACADETTSTCSCYSDAGPLPPPDLPNRIA